MTNGTRPPPAPKASTAKTISFGKPQEATGHRVLMYGPGGIGKTTLAVSAPGPVAVFDFDDSLPRLKTKMEKFGLEKNFSVVQGVVSWGDMLDALWLDGWGGVKTIVIDSLTKAEELLVAHTLAMVPKDSGGAKARNLEDYGYGKGYRHTYDQFLPLLAALDVHCRAGRNVVLVCHETSANVPNPIGPDWIRYEPRLMQTGQGMIRMRVKEWCDHVLFVGYDVDVQKGKGVGSGTATLWPNERPYFMAKSRTLTAEMPLENCYAGLWPALLEGGK